MRATPYGSTPLCRMAFGLSIEVRRFALWRAAKYGHVTLNDVKLEFADYNRSTAWDALETLVKYGLLLKDSGQNDRHAPRTPKKYRLTDDARQGLEELSQLTEELKIEMGIL